MILEYNRNLRQAAKSTPRKVQFATWDNASKDEVPLPPEPGESTDAATATPVSATATADPENPLLANLCRQTGPVPLSDESPV
jgi:hypothetical protein